jgi:hypothetical protein
MSKYDALYDFLEQIPPDARERKMTFAEVERVLGFKLPKSAYVYRQWWANPSSPHQHPHAQSWLAAGWMVDTVDQQERWVRFRRGGRSHTGAGTSQVPRTSKPSPGKGRQFQERARELLSERFQVDFRLDYPIAIGYPPKEHRFDLVSSDLRHVGECKNYSWTKSGNVPSAKLGFVNEAVFYLSFLPEHIVRFVVMRKDTHPIKSETLAEYYFRTYRHLLKGVFVLEIELENDAVREIGRAS